MLVASRYVSSGTAAMPALRRFASRALNIAFRRGLSLGVLDSSSAIRLYRSETLRALSLHADGYDILQEALVRAHIGGWRVREIPMAYTANGEFARRPNGAGGGYISTFWQMWKLRNSIAAADYDFRAHDSRSRCSVTGSGAAIAISPS